MSPLAFAIGVYLPLATMAAIFVGGAVRALSQHRGAAPSTDRADAGVLAASGLVVGEGLAGVLVAGLVAAGIAPRSMEPWLTGAAGSLAAIALLAAVCAFLYRAGRAVTAAPPPRTGPRP